MKLLVPLGLLGLLSIIALIIIYLIKPNFQPKTISSTFIWKLSLKYKKKRIPISKLRNILLIICQILILTACAFILAQPNKVLMVRDSGLEAILVLDSSASMRTGTNNDSRYLRAVDAIILKADEIVKKEGKVSVIIADNNPHFLAGQQYTLDNIDVLEGELLNLKEEFTQCTYGTADIEKAMDLCEDIVALNEETMIYIYTDNDYLSLPKGIEAIDVTDPNDWNIGIINAEAFYEDNFYGFRIEVAAYGRDTQDVKINVSVKDANAYGEEAGYTTSFSSEPLKLIGDEPVTVIFKVNTSNDSDPNFGTTSSGNQVTYELIEGNRIFSFESVHISVTDKNGEYIDDSFYEDDDFYIFGGKKQPLRIQYCSSLRNPYMFTVLSNYSVQFEQYYDVELSEVGKLEEAQNSGFDFYIYEHIQPFHLPDDGVVFLIDPSETPAATDFTLGSYVQLSRAKYATQDVEHVLMKNVVVGNIAVTMYTRLATYDDCLYTSLMSVDGNPLFLVRNDNEAKIAVVLFSLHYSTWPLTMEFPLMMYNIFKFYFPPTIESNAFNVNDVVTLNARGVELTVSGAVGEEVTYTEFPAKFSASGFGEYKIKQVTFAGNEITESFYARIPKEESNIWTEVETVTSPFLNVPEHDYFKDFLMYLAIGLVALLFIEWILQSRDNM